MFNRTILDQYIISNPACFTVKFTLHACQIQFTEQNDYNIIYVHWFENERDKYFFIVIS